MSALIAKVIRQTRRPIPELYELCHGKLLSLLWRRHLASVGPHFHVSRGARIMGASRVSMGDHFYAGPNLWIQAVQRYEGVAYDSQIVIGQRFSGSESVHIASSDMVVIGNDVLFGSRVHVTDHAHGRYSGKEQDAPGFPPLRRALLRGRKVRIGDNVWLGDNVVVLPGVTIGAGTVVGANSVVSRSLPPEVIAVGAPARPIKRWDAGRRAWLPCEAAP